MREYLAVHTLGDTLVRYPIDRATGCIGLELVPLDAIDLLVEPRATLAGEPFIEVLPGNGTWPARPVDSLVQLKLVGDEYPGAFAQGHTMRNSGTVKSFRFEKQEIEGCSIVTTLARNDGCHITHRLSWREGDHAFTITTSFTNGSATPVKLEMLSSFSLCGISSFHPADSPNRLHLHRFRSAWSAEGRHEVRSIEELHLERSWSGAGAFSERFGQLGTMPVRRWFPFVAAEDREAGVLWGAQLSWAGSWQMEIYRQNDDVALSGGLADREFGHWMKTIEPAETFTAPSATLTCVRGDFPTLCDRLIEMHEAPLASQPEIDHELPVIFNEWCTTWGDPSHENITALADRLQGTGVRYLVIDAGWYKSADTDWSSGHGDWNPSPELFPNGLKATADAIRARGLVPGLWFEMETVGSQSTAFKLGKHLLQRDGIPITVRDRRFWDLSDPAAIDYLTEKVIDLLESCGFGYLKVDYNETAGLGCDHPDSQGEGLRLQIDATYRFFQRIRERLPHLVIENCSSGGHRLEPSMLALTAMSSFSDAHELVEIPLIAANLHQLILPRQNQIWAVLHPSDSLQRLYYSLSATFLGRMCLSGNIRDLSPEAWATVREAIRFYQEVAPIIREGISRKHSALGPSFRHPTGWQALVRIFENRCLIVVHTFENAPANAVAPLGADWKVIARFGDNRLQVDLADDGLRLGIPCDFTALVLLLERVP